MPSAPPLTTQQAFFTPGVPCFNNRTVGMISKYQYDLRVFVRSRPLSFFVCVSLTLISLASLNSSMLGNAIKQASTLGHSQIQIRQIHSQTKSDTES